MEKVIKLLEELKKAIQEIPTAKVVDAVDVNFCYKTLAENIEHARVAAYMDHDYFELDAYKKVGENIDLEAVARHLDEQSIADYVSNVVEIDTRDIAEEIDIEDVAAQLSTFIDYKKLAKELIAELKAGNDEK